MDEAVNDLDATILAKAQETLAKAVARSRAGEDRELAQQVRQGGEAIASVLAGLFKLSRIHSPENRAFDVPVAELSRALAELVNTLGTIHLVTADEQVYVNEVRLRVEALAGLKDLEPELSPHNAGGITFHAPLSTDLVRALLGAFAKKPAETAPRQALQAALIQSGVTTVEVTPRLRLRAHDEQGDFVRDPKGTLARTLRLVDEAYANVGYGRVLSPLPLRRAVVEILQIGPAVPAFWESLGEGAPHASHATTVALISLLVGRTAGFSTGLLHDLGVAALAHDIGYTCLPLNAAAGLEGLSRHPGEGARAMLRQRGFHVAKLRRLRAVLDHHRDHSEPSGNPSVLGEVLRIAEDYSTLVRVYRGRLSPAEALGAMARVAGNFYEPTLMQITVNVLGRHPPGTLLELHDGRLVRSVAPVQSPRNFALPLVREVDPSTRSESGEPFELGSEQAIRRVLRS